MPHIRSTLCLALLASACSSGPPADEPGGPGGPGGQVGAGGEVAAFVAAEVAAYKPLYVAAQRAGYDAAISGTDEDFARSKRADVALGRYLADPTRFARIGALRGKVDDPLLARQVEMLYLQMLGRQFPAALLEQITALEKQVEQMFNTHRGKVGGEPKTRNQIDAILTESTDSTELQAAWAGQKSVGAAVNPKLMELVALRNQVARELGFRDFYALKLAEAELDEAELLALFDELDELTRAPFLAAKAEVDARLASRLGVGVDALMPWHYQDPFFQEPPAVFETGLDAIYKAQDAAKLTLQFYAGIGLPAEDIVARSDLYEKPGKTQHAFAVDIDHEGDVRVMVNIVPGLRWTNTMIHELGHAVYDKFIDRQLPWLLREPTHPLTTEGLAMMMDRLVASTRWAQAMGLMTAEQASAAAAEARSYQAFAALQFSRWTQVMLRFERGMYGDPGQDLSKLWWDLVERYQGLRRPPGRDAPDYASKIHLVVAPVYYQNYMLGKLFGAQVHEAIAAHVGQDPGEAIYVGDERVGAFLRDRVFGPGARYRWDELTERATGSPLGPAAFARRFRSK